KQFHTWKGLNYVPENLHPTIKWSVQYPNPLEAYVQDIPWQIVNQKENLNSNLNNSVVKASKSFTAAKGSVPLLHKNITPTKSERPTKKQKMTNFEEDNTPPGTQWDGNNYSCAYDALFTILFNIWATKLKKMEEKKFQESNQYLVTLHDGFQKYLRVVSTLETARDSVRTLLHKNDPVLFPSGHTGCVCLCVGHTNVLS
ncbi:hypothetical protein PILCRDRAFT_80959, partial [Piloderma croceum F 1598]